MGWAERIDYADGCPRPEIRRPGRAYVARGFETVFPSAGCSARENCEEVEEMVRVLVSDAEGASPAGALAPRSSSRSLADAVATECAPTAVPALPSAAAVTDAGRVRVSVSGPYD